MPRKQALSAMRLRKKDGGKRGHDSLTLDPQFCWAGPTCAVSMTNFDNARPMTIMNTLGEFGTRRRVEKIEVALRRSTAA